MNQGGSYNLYNLYPWMNFLDVILLGILLSTHNYCALTENYGTSWRSQGAFAALRQDGRVVAWGDSRRGGSIPSSVSS